MPQLFRSHRGGSRRGLLIQRDRGPLPLGQARRLLRFRRRSRNFSRGSREPGWIVDSLPPGEDLLAVKYPLGHVKERERQESQSAGDVQEVGRVEG